LYIIFISRCMGCFYRRDIRGQNFSLLSTVSSGHHFVFYLESCPQTTRLWFYFLTQPKSLFFLGFCKTPWCLKTFQGRSWWWSCGGCNYSCLCNQYLSPPKICVRGVLDTTLSLSVSCSRSVFFSEYSGFLHQ
jgi:hypothetical protein